MQILRDKVAHQVHTRAAVEMVYSQFNKRVGPIHAQQERVNCLRGAKTPI